MASLTRFAAAQPDHEGVSRDWLRALVAEQRADQLEQERNHPVSILDLLTSKRALGGVVALALFVGGGATIAAALAGHAGAVLGVFVEDDGANQNVDDGR